MDVLIILLVVMSVCIPAAIFILRLRFKKSILFIAGLIWLISQSIVAIISYYMGTRENMSDFIWAAPIVVLLVISGYYYLYRFIRYPFTEVIKSISDITSGNLRVSFRQKYLEREDELGIISKHINRMSIELNKVISQIYNEANSLNKTSSHLSTKAAVCRKALRNKPVHTKSLHHQWRKWQLIFNKMLIMHK